MIRNPPPRVRALCSDGQFRMAYLHRGWNADTFFSVPAQVKVRHEGRSKSVTGFITNDSICEPQYRFTADANRKNSHLLP